LYAGGGICGAIHDAAGSELSKACRTMYPDGCPTGETATTPGFKLPARFVLHTVGPMGENAERLTNCYRTILDECVRYQLRTVAVCCVSTGIYGYPNEPAARVALQTVRQWLDQDTHRGLLDRVVFCTFLAVDVEIYRELLPVYFPPARPHPSPTTSPATTSEPACGRVMNRVPVSEACDSPAAVAAYSPPTIGSSASVPAADESVTAAVAATSPPISSLPLIRTVSAPAASVHQPSLSSDCTATMLKMAQSLRDTQSNPESRSTHKLSPTSTSETAAPAPTSSSLPLTPLLSHSAGLVASASPPPPAKVPKFAVAVDVDGDSATTVVVNSAVITQRDVVVED
jgi:O-acetyl-ADP-ribose deacetylase (regulator of RNase III)